MVKEVHNNKNSSEKKKNTKKLMTTKRIGSSANESEGGDFNMDQEEQKTKVHKRPTKKVIYIEIDDEITAIYDRLKQIKVKNIYIVVPKRAILFQSIINLKILKRKAEDLEKSIYIITNDPNGLHLAKQIGLIVYDKLEGHEHPSLVSGKFLEDQQNITPLKASINALEDDMPTRQTEKKLSISEILQKGKGKGLALIAKSFSLKPKAVKEQTTKMQNIKSKLVLIAPNRQALFALVVVSLIILLTITYIALPGATITLTPTQDVLKNTVNVTLADVKFNEAELSTHPPHEIPSYSITKTIQRPLTYQTTGVELGSESQEAKGFVTVINTTNADQALKATTRFQTSDNLVFRSQNAVTVPAQKGNVPGTKDVAVVADRFDALNQVIGERGNIGPTRFTIPGLLPATQKKIYAESKGAMIGGKASTVRVVSQQDLDAAQKKLEDDLKNSAQVELQAQANKGNSECKTNLVLLMDSKAIQTSEPTISLPANLEGQKLTSFDLQGEIEASGVAYCREDLMNILQTELKLKKTSDTRLVPTNNEDSLTYRIAEIDPIAKKIKITATIKGLVEYDLNPEKENGDRLIKQIKEHVVGKEIQEARDYIQNLPQIDKVKIDSWPAWAPTLPSVPDNIKVEIANSGE